MRFQFRGETGLYRRIGRPTRFEKVNYEVDRYSCYFRGRGVVLIYDTRVL